MKKDLLVRAVLVIAPALFVLIIGLLLGVIVLVSPPVHVSTWGLVWRVFVGFTCVGIIYYLLTLGKRREQTELGKTTSLKSGTWSVVGVIYDSVPVGGGNLERDVVLVLRRLGDSFRERHLYVISDDLLGQIRNPLRSALANNNPKFHLLVEPDGQSAILCQDRNGERLHELKLDLNK